MVDQVEWAGIRRAYDYYRHTVRPANDRHGHWIARNPGQGWNIEFDGRGFEVTPQSGEWTWGLELKSFGRKGNPLKIDGTSPIRTSDNRVVYEVADGLEEWFINDSRGLEHGFTLSKRPSGDQGGLMFEIATRGPLMPKIRDSTDTRYLNENGQEMLAYSGLKVWDDTGRVLPARFEPGSGGIRLIIDDSGAQYPITVDPVAHQTRLTAPNADAEDDFGRAVAVSGETVIVGAPREDSGSGGVNGDQDNNNVQDSGAAYVFIRSGSTWQFQAYLKAPTPRMGFRFGHKVSIWKDRVLIGESDGASNAGAAHLFERTGNEWEQILHIHRSDIGFGSDVSIDADTIVVGACGESNTVSGAGAAYVYAKSGTFWNQQARLVAGNPGLNNSFGCSLSISGDTIVVGATGEESSTTGVNSQPNDSAGWLTGAAYVFVRSGTNWTQQAYLKASNTDPDDRFGNAVSVSGNTIVVGAYFEDSAASGIDGNQADNSASTAGAAYVFSRTGTTWAQQAYLKASNPDPNNYFGSSVSVSGNTVIVGAHNEESRATGVNGNQSDNSGNGVGAAYLFRRTGSTWQQTAYLKGVAPVDNDRIGVSVDVSGYTLVVGAPITGSNDAGAAHVYVDSAAEPAIEFPPHAESNTPIAGDNVTLSVGAVGSQPFGYQWRKDGVPIDGATSSSFTISDFQAGDIGEYDVRVHNGSGFAISAPVFLNLRLTINTQPQNLNISPGEMLLLGVDASGGPTLEYQWRFDGVAIPEETRPNLRLFDTRNEHAGDYDVVISDGRASITSSVATVTVSLPASLTNGLQAYWAFNDGTASDSSGRGVHGLASGVTITNGYAEFSGNDSGISFDGELMEVDEWSVTAWLRNQGPAGTDSVYLGMRYETSPGVHGNGFQLQINQFGRVASNHGKSPNWGVVSSNSIADGNWHHVVFTYSARTASVYIDGVLEASHVGPTDFAWGNSPNFFIGRQVYEPSRPSFAGLMDEMRIYDRVLIVDEIGQLAAELPGRPFIIGQTTSMVLTNGSSADLSIVASGEDLAYQWRKDGVDLQNETNANLSIANFQASQAGAYQLTITNLQGSIASEVMYIALATKTWIGGQGNDNWNLAANWSGGEVPTIGDNVLIDDPNVTVTNASGDLNNLYCLGSIHNNQNDLTIRFGGVVRGNLSLVGGAQRPRLIVNNRADSSFSTLGETAASHADLQALNGGTIRLRNMEELSSSFVTADNGALIDLPDTKRIVVTNSVGAGPNGVEALRGARVLLPALTNTIGQVRLSANGGGSLVQANSLLSMNGADLSPSNQVSRLLVENGGSMELANLHSATNIDLRVLGGSSLALPALTNFAKQTPDGTAVVQVSGSNSLLEIDILSRISGGTGAGMIDLRTEAGGTLRLPLLRTIDGNVRIHATGRWSTNWISNLTLFDSEGGQAFLQSYKSAYIDFGTGPVTLKGVATELRPDNDILSVIRSREFVFDGNSTITGSGMLWGSVSCAGEISPGIDSGIGNIFVTSALTLEDGANLKMQVNGPGRGTGYDYVGVGGIADLGGTLHVDATELPPNTGEEFEIVRYDSIRPGIFFRVTQSAFPLIYRQTSNALAVISPKSSGFDRQPIGTNVVVGGDLLLSVSSTGVPDPTIQWRFNQQILPEETQPILRRRDVSPEFAGKYDVIIANIGGSVTSEVAIVTVDSNVSADLSSLSNGLVAYWPFDAGSLNDFSGHGNHGNYVGAERAVVVPGYNGATAGGMSFPSNSQIEITVPDSLVFGFAGDFSVSAWIRPEDSNTTRSIVSKYNSSVDGRIEWDLNYESGEIVFAVFKQGLRAESGLRYRTINAGLRPGRWSDVTAVYDRGLSLPRIFVDGVEAATEMLPFNGLSAGISRIFDGDEPIRIGSSRNFNNELGTFTGAIDEVRLYNRALTLAEIEQLASVTVVLPDPIVHWTFDDPANIGRDSSGNDYDLTIPGTWQSAPGVSPALGKAIRFDALAGQSANFGSSSLGPIAPTTDGLNAPGPFGFTVAYWLKVEPGKGAVVGDYWAHRAFGEVFGLKHGGGNFSFMVRHDFSDPDLIEVDASSYAGQYVQLVGVYEPEGTKTKLYVNGLLAGQLTLPGPMRNSPTNLYVSGSWHGTIESTVDDVRLIGTALTDAQVQKLFRDTSTPDLNRLADATFEGDANNLRFGNSVAFGDFNGDGLEDLAVGAEGSGVPEDTSDPNKAGRVFIYFGPISSGQAPDVIINAPTPSAQFGYAIWNAGDVNEDRIDDLLIGAPFDGGSGDFGNAFFYHGGAAFSTTPSLIFESGIFGDNFSIHGSAGGDVNGDGVADVILSAGSGLRIYFGGSGMDTTADKTFGSSAAVDMRSSVNGDIYADVIVGLAGDNRAASAAGAVEIFHGATDMDTNHDLRLLGENQDDNFGTAVVTLDVNGDGHADVAVGAPGNDDAGSDAGKVYVFLGGSNMDATADKVLYASSGGGRFGFLLAAVPDINGDGADELLVGAPDNFRSGSAKGAAFLFAGNVSNIVEDTPIATFDSEKAGSGIGGKFLYPSMAGGNDITGDGLPDIAIGSPRYDGSTADSGKLYLYSLDPSGANHADLAQGLIAYYPLNGNADDASGNSNHGVVQGAAPTADRSGAGNGAYSFDGTASISIPTTGFPAGNAPRTLAAWIRPMDLTNRMDIVGYGISDNFDEHRESSLGVSASTPAPLFVDIYNEHAGAAPFVKGDEWQHVAAVYDGSTWAFYHNGNPFPVTHVPPVLNTRLGNGYIGRRAAEAEAFFRGDIDEVRIYDRALSTMEMAQLAQLRGPVIVGQTGSQVLGNGAAVDLTVIAGNQASTSIQWQKDGVDIPNATDATYSIGAFQSADAGVFRAIVSSPVGSITNREIRLAEATKTWDGEAGDLQWTSAANWEPDGVPGASDYVLIDGSALGTIQHTSGNTRVRGIQCGAGFSITGNSFTVTDFARFDGAFAANGDCTLIAGGNGTRFEVNGMATVDLGHLTARDGAAMEFEELNRYTQPNGVSYVAAQNGGTIILGGLTNLVGSSGGASDSGIRMTAEAGGSIQLPDLLKMTRSVRVFADGSGSRIDLPALVETDATGRHPGGGYQQLTAKDGGVVSVPALTTITGTYFSALGGSVLRVPSARTFVGEGNGNGAEAFGEGSVVDLSGVTSFTGTTGGRHLSIPTRVVLRAWDGGQVLVDGVPSLDNQVQVLASGTNSRVHLGSVTNLDGTVVNGSGDKLHLIAETNGLIVLGGEVLATSTDFILRAGGEMEVGELLFMIDGSVLSGDGTLRGDVLNGNSGNPAIVRPGGAGSGVLRVTGDYMQPGGTLAIDLGGTTLGSQHDQLVIDGRYTHIGSLEVSLIDEFVPAEGDRFVFISYADRDVGSHFLANNLPANTRLVLSSAAGVIEMPHPHLHISKLGGGQVSIEPAQTNFVFGDSVSLISSNTLNHGFSHWLSNGVVLSSNLTLVHSIEATNSYRAVFTNSRPLETHLDVLQQHVYGGTNSDLMQDMAVATDGSVYLFGDSSSGNEVTKPSAPIGQGDIWVNKVDRTGKVIWEKTYGTGNIEFHAHGIATSDSGVLLFANSSPGTPSQNDTLVMKIDSDGEVDWQQTYGGGDEERVLDALELPGGDFLIAGSSKSAPGPNKESPHYGDFDMWLMRLRPDGSKVWDRSYGGTGEDCSRDIIYRSGYVLICGISASGNGSGNRTAGHYGDRDLWLVTIDLDGNIVSQASLGGAGEDEVREAVATEDGGVVLAGYSDSGTSDTRSVTSAGDFDIWIVKLDIHLNVEWQQSFGGNDREIEPVVQPLPDGRYLVACASESGVSGNKGLDTEGGYDTWLLLLDSTGQKLQERVFGGERTESYEALVSSSLDLLQVEDDAVWLGTFSNSPQGGTKTVGQIGGNDMWLIRLHISEIAEGAPRIMINGVTAGTDVHSFVHPVAINVDMTTSADLNSKFLLYSINDPDPLGGNEFTGPFTVSDSAEIRAVVVDDDFQNPRYAAIARIEVLPEFSLTDVTPGGGSVVFEPAKPKYVRGETVTLTATPSNGWDFAHWELVSALGTMYRSNAITTLSMDTNYSARAVFVTDINNVASPRGQITNSPSGLRHAYGTRLVLTAIPDPNFYFFDWRNDVSGTVSPVVHIVTNANPRIVAFYNPVSPSHFPISMSVDGIGTIEVNRASNNIPAGESVMLTAIPGLGQNFLRWDGVAGAENPRTVVMNGPTHVRAVFGNEQPPKIVSHPDSSTNRIGDHLLLSVSATGSDPLDYFWRHNGEVLPTASGPSLMLNDLRGIHAGTYDVLVSNALGVVASEPAQVHVLEVGRLRNSGRWGTDGPINALAMGNGQLLVGGSFTAFAPVVGSAGVMHTNGSVDFNWPGFYESVTASVVDDRGGIYVACQHGNAQRIYRVNQDGTIDGDFSVHLAGPVGTMVFHDDALWVGGGFQGVHGDSNYKSVAKLNGTSGALNSDWAPGINGVVHALAVSEVDNSIFIGGEIDDRHLIKLDMVSGNQVNGFGAYPDGLVNALVLTNGVLYVGGHFTKIGGREEQRLAALRVQDGAPRTGWTANVLARTGVEVMHIIGDTLFVGGTFAAATDHSNHPGPDDFRSNLAAFDLNTGEVQPWAPEVDGNVEALCSVGQILYIGGAFSEVEGITRHNACAVKAFATSDYLTDWHPSVNDSVQTLSALQDRVIVGGGFNLFARQFRTNLFALDLNSGFASSWTPNPNAPVNALAVANQRLYVGGQFTEISQNSRNYAAAYQLSGSDPSLDSWQSGASDFVLSLVATHQNVFLGGRSEVRAVDARTGTQHWRRDLGDGSVHALCLLGERLFAGGEFDLGSGAINLAALAVFDGETVASLSSPNNTVQTLATDGSKIYFGGLFTEFDGVTVPGIGALHTDSLKRDSWRPDLRFGAKQSVNAMTVDRDRIYLGGTFKYGDGVSTRFAVVDPTGDSILDEGVQVGHYLGDVVNAIAVHAGTAFIGGEFRHTGAEPAQRNSANLAMVGPEGPPRSAIQSQSIDRTAGDSLTLSADVSGAAPLFIQWFRDDVLLAGETGDHLMIAGLEAHNAGSYSYVASNAQDQISNLVAIVTIQPAPNTRILVGEYRRAPGEPLVLPAPVDNSFQVTWMRNDVAIPGATNRNLVFTNLLVADSGKYRYRLHNENNDGGDSDPIDVIVRGVETPFADDLADRLVISGIRGSVGGDNFSASFDPFEQAHVRRRGDRSVWFEWAPDLNGPVTFHTLGSGRLTQLAVYTGDTYGTLQKVISDERSGPYQSSFVTFAAVAGTKYVIAVDAVRRAGGYLVLNWLQTVGEQDVPVIIDITQGQTLTDESESVTFTANVPTAAQLQWFHLEEPVEGATNNALTIMSGSADKVGNYRLRASIDDVVVWAQAGALELGPTADVRSLDRFDDLFGQSGRTPAGIGVVNETILPGLAIRTGQAVSQTIWLDKESASDLYEPIVGGSGRGNTRWLSFTPAEAGLVVIETKSTTVDPVMAVYSGDSLTNLRLEAADRNKLDGRNAQLAFPAQARRTYLLLVDRENRNSGAVSLDFYMGEPPVFVRHPQNQIAPLGTPITLEVELSGVPMLQIQWFFNDTAIPNATNATYSIPSLSRAAVGVYKVIASNPVDFSQSTSAQVILNELQLDRDVIRRSDGDWELHVDAPVGATVIIDVNTDGTFRTWDTIHTFTSTGDDPPIIFSEPAGAESAIFRARYFHQQ